MHIRTLARYKCSVIDNIEALIVLLLYHFIFHSSVHWFRMNLLCSELLDETSIFGFIRRKSIFNKHWPAQHFQVFIPECIKNIIRFFQLQLWTSIACDEYTCTRISTELTIWDFAYDLMIIYRYIYFVLYMAHSGYSRWCETC